MSLASTSELIHAVAKRGFGIVAVNVATLEHAKAIVIPANRTALPSSSRSALHALALNPLVPDPATAEAMLDDARATHRPILDAFAVGGSKR